MTPVPSPSASPPPAPILVTGPPRSGTTWVGKTLALEPTLGYLHEPFSIATDPGLSSAPFPRMFEYIDEDNEHLYAPGLERTMRFDYATGAQLATLRTPRDVVRTVRDQAMFRRLRRERRRPLFKDPIAVFSAEWIARRYGASVVLTVRHPAAVAASFKRLGWEPRFQLFLEQPRLLEAFLTPYVDEIEVYAKGGRPSLEQGAFLWRLVAHVLDEFRRRHPDWLLVRQEDLSRAPVAGFSQIFSYLGLTFAPAIEQQIVANSSAENPAALVTSHAIRLDSLAALASWKRHLSPDEIDRVREIAGETADAFYAAEEW
jgi:Sulfotransferase family